MVSALNEEHDSNVCKAVCNIHKYPYTNLAINTYIPMLTYDIHKVAVTDFCYVELWHLVCGVDKMVPQLHTPTLNNFH